MNLANVGLGVPYCPTAFMPPKAHVGSFGHTPMDHNPEQVITLEYFDIRVKIRWCRITEAVSQLEKLAQHHRARVMKGVRRALREAQRTARNPGLCKLLNDAQKQTIVDDVTLWFANEILEGRSGEYHIH